MNIASWDLNLLVVFDALMAEQHLTRASERVGLSQPATSNALARLRKLTQDDLFIRAGGTFRPTPVAIALAKQIQPALQQIETALAQTTSFDPATSDRVFSLGLSDYTAFLLLPDLLKAIKSEAAKIAIQVRTGERSWLLKLLDDGKVDLVCGVFPEKVAWHNSQKLFEETFACVCRQGHPHIDSEISIQQYIEADHLLVSIAGDRSGRIDHILSQQGLTRHIAVSVPHFLVAPFILAQTDLIATLAKRVAESFAPMQALKLLPPPVNLTGFSVSMRWHQSSQNHPDQAWLRTQVEQVSQKFVHSTLPTDRRQ
ncbi:LysR family transcriptional regulator [Almyronema epifaneia]|uniref:LysR family transcriptional regulator n=1 Tax=Almyronema epifaneia S1 TaxID=2991925 RepID=A0ABW6IK25_9CYAN